ncbi:prepilin-type N-terminal cleavage/methylation domain-containing protein [Tissierella praeacuta]|uniref:type II secretion system protein n=1 Tax=Tissierella praeacuta TaxID=43131 RepID=UPI0033402217
MLKKINKKRNRKGFTLVELVVVIAILGILSAIAVPKLGASRKNAANTAHEANIRALTGAATMFIADTGVPTAEIKWTPKGGTKASDITDTSTNDNKWALYLQEWPKAPTGISKTEDNGKDYTVTIKETGDIEVNNETAATP